MAEDGSTAAKTADLEKNYRDATNRVLSLLVKHAALQSQLSETNQELVQAEVAARITQRRYLAALTGEQLDALRPKLDAEQRQKIVERFVKGDEL
jgi:hypothetical protein